MNKQDFFYQLMTKGILISSGIDSDIKKTYRTFKFQDRKYKLTLEVLEWI